MKSLQVPKKKYCIQTLTHDYARAGSLLKMVVDQFVKNTDIDSTVNGKLDWYVRVNGLNKDLQSTLDIITRQYSDLINWHIFIGENIGVGAGINLLNEQCLDYEYTLFIEGDWICLDSEVSGASTSWLKDSISILDKNPQVGQVFLRRHISDVEDRQYGMSNWFNSSSNISEQSEGATNFIHLSEGKYTNNPTLKRQQSYYDVGIFPLNEYYSQDGIPTEVKTYIAGKQQLHSDWGQAEIVAMPKGHNLENFWLWPGNFHHVSNLSIQDYISPCQQCKYGFFKPSVWFCLSCSSNEQFFQLSDHTNRGITQILENLRHTQDKKLEITSNVKLIESVVQNPTIPPNTLINLLNNR